jgi:hypothetical protein
MKKFGDKLVKKVTDFLHPLPHCKYGALIVEK